MAKTERRFLIMKMASKKRVLGYIALALVCVLIGYGMNLNTATAETVVVTSPFTEAVAKVRDSVVGVSNYQMVRVGSNNNSSYYGINPFDFFGFGNFGYGYGYGNDYGYGYGNDNGKSEEVEYATGSGVVIGDGYVLTNHHVVEGASALKITISAENEEEAKTLDAVLVADDETIDVAVLYVEGLDLPAVELGDSDTLQVGDWAICIGNPLSNKFAGTVTAGIVSGLDRKVDEKKSTDKYGRRETIVNKMIQVDAAINNGNSGGGMFNTQGQLMGIPTLKYSGSTSSTSASIEGIGMCIPINAAKPIIEEGLKAEKPAVGTTGTSASGIDLTGKPRLGVTGSDINENSVAFQQGLIPDGVLISEVQEGSPAAAAGMLANDIIVDIDDTVITSMAQMQKIIADHKAGDTLKIKVFRMEDAEDPEADGEYIDLEVTLAVVDISES